MKVAVFDIHRFERPYFEKALKHSDHEVVFFEAKLKEDTAELATGCEVVCSFVNDSLNATTLKLLQGIGVQLIALRSAGFNHVDLPAAQLLNLKVVRVPEYSPYAVAEFAMALILTLNRKIHRSYQRVREDNFSLDGLVGFDLHEKTIGIIGTGKIGRVFAKICHGFGCKLLASDNSPDPQLQRYVPLSELYSTSEIISLHVPLSNETRHMINHESLQQMKPGVMLINTGRGALIDTTALITGLKSGHIGYAGLDVYEEEEKYFFQDFSDQVLQDDVLARLLTFQNVVVTSHQGFLTHEALTRIVTTTLKSISEFESKLLRLNLAEIAA